MLALDDGLCKIGLMLCSNCAPKKLVSAPIQYDASPRSYTVRCIAALMDEAREAPIFHTVNVLIVPLTVHAYLNGRQIGMHRKV